MSGNLEGRVAIVTGAAKGMGAEICLALAREGAHVALAARDRGPLETLARLVERTKSALGGRIDVLVNGAGVTGPVETPVWEIKTEDWDDVLAVNVKGTFLPIKHVLPTMIAQRYGKIVNISGTSGLRGYKMRAAYSSSKWALRGLTRTVALEAGPYNINVNALHPGIVDGPRMDRLCREKARKRGWTPEQVREEYLQEMALRRVTTARNIADAVVFLASDASQNMTGQSITVDGGWDV
ncbi:MAG: short-chain dehydrogenase [Candidatus Rokuibacteriota bacterium]|nr:MAG: short-chain dehydrogenase [Candidatus Rokubacteria bacterium]